MTKSAFAVTTVTCDSGGRGDLIITFSFVTNTFLLSAEGTMSPSHKPAQASFVDVYVTHRHLTGSFRRVCSRLSRPSHSNCARLAPRARLGHAIGRPPICENHAAAAVARRAASELLGGYESFVATHELREPACKISAPASCPRRGHAGSGFYVPPLPARSPVCPRRARAAHARCPHPLTRSRGLSAPVKYTRSS